MGTASEQEGEELSMQTLLQKPQLNPETNIRKSTLLDLIAQWPDWKIQALCLDESDLEIKEAIQSWRKSQQ